MTTTSTTAALSSSSAQSFSSARLVSTTIVVSFGSHSSASSYCCSLSRSRSHLTRNEPTSPSSTAAERTYLLSDNDRLLSLSLSLRKATTKTAITGLRTCCLPPATAWSRLVSSPARSLSRQPRARLTKSSSASKGTKQRQHQHQDDGLGADKPGSKNGTGRGGPARPGGIRANWHKRQHSAAAPVSSPRCPGAARASAA